MRIEVKPWKISVLQNAIATTNPRLEIAYRMIGNQDFRRVDSEGQSDLSSCPARRGGRPRRLSAAEGKRTGVVDLGCWFECFEWERLCDGAGVEERLVEGEDLCVARELLLARLPEELEMSARGV